MLYRINGARAGGTIHTEAGWVKVNADGTAVIHSKEQVAELKGMGFTVVKHDGKVAAAVAAPPADNTDVAKRLEDARKIGDAVTHQETEVLGRPKRRRGKDAAEDAETLTDAAGGGDDAGEGSEEVLTEDNASRANGAE